MHIHQIEIDNFKSFVGKTVIPFEKGFTTISGPNGSGKSNIIDSVLFCLGLSSSRTMRAERLPDLINNQSKRREAMVTITFRKEAEEVTEFLEEGAEKVHEKPPKVRKQPPSELPEALPSVSDPTTGLLEASEAGASEALNPKYFLCVSRRIRDGANGYTSTYYLNGHTTTLTEIHDHLSKFNVSPGCYNVMMQGDVAGIVNMSSLERRKIIDEIAGVAEFDRKIDQAEQEIDVTGTNIERNHILLTELESRLEQLLTEREKALAYQALRQEHQTLEILLLATKLKDLEASLETNKLNLTQARTQKEEARRDLTQLQQGIGQTQNQLLRVSEEVKRKGEDQQIAIKKQIEGLKGHIARKEDSIRFLKQQVYEGTQQIEKMKRDIVRFQENGSIYEDEIAALVHKRKELQSFYDQEKKLHDEANRRFDELTGDGGEWATKRLEIRAMLESMSDESASLHRQKLDIESEWQRLHLDRDRLERTASEGSSKQDQLQHLVNELRQRVTALQDEKISYETALQKKQLDFSQMRVAFGKAADSVITLQRELTQLDARKRALEEVHFGRAIEIILKSGMEGLHGTLSQLGQVEETYSLAMEIALGGRLQNVVVEDDRVAKQAIDFLQRNRGGRATFLPLNKIKPTHALPGLPRGAGVIDFAFHLIDFDPLYTQIYAFALGDTLIVEDIESVRPLMQRYRMVTLDGSLLEKSGAMTGGSSPSAGRGGSGSRFANTSQLDVQLRQLQEKLETEAQNKSRVEKHLLQLENTLDTLKTEYGQCLQFLASATTEFTVVEKQLQALTQASAAQDPKLLQQFHQREADLREALVRIETASKQTQDQQAILQRELSAVEQQIPTDQLEELRVEMSNVKFQMDHYDSQLRNLQSDIKSKEMERQYQAVGIQEFEERITTMQKQFVGYEKEEKDHLQEIDLSKQQIRDLEAQTTELNQELKQLQEERDGIQQQLLELEKQKSQCERVLNQVDEQILSYQARIRELDPQIKEARLAWESAKPEDATVESLFLQLYPENSPLEAKREPLTQEHLQKKMGKLTTQMQALEPVNMLAIQEYDMLLERKTELSDKVETLQREREDLREKIQSYEELKRTAFMEAFTHVDSHFKTIFAGLSDGDGRLVLTRPESPFEGGLTIEAQPRGKKLQRLEAMSGGEKSLTSLAFVFALQRTMPAPFYALDEVDMNLDGLNVEKLAHLLRTESNQGAQFIVVSLRKPMIEHSDRTVGVTQRNNGITKVAGIKHRLEEITVQEPVAVAS